jgi:diguanylate cyclase (GGDEF)-like protein
MSYAGPQDDGFARELVLHARSAILVCRSDRVVTFATPHAVRVFGGEVLGCDVASLVAPAAADALISYLARLAGASEDVAAHCETRTALGGERVLDMVGVSRLADPAIRGIVLSISDITALSIQAEMLERQARVDALTGLPNRSVFEDRLQEAIRSGHGGVLAMLDLDSFKQVNDAFGHQAGDALLIAFGRTALEALAGTERATLARVGGDEFALLLPEIGMQAATSLIERVQQSVAMPHRIGDHEISITVSAGLAELDPTSVSRTVTAADVAMYVAKERRWSHVVHTRELADSRRRLSERLETLRHEVETSRLEARTDSLTELPNRRRYDEDLEALDRGVEDGSYPYSAIAIDLDHFGAFNKQGGQDMGDTALRAAAKVLRSAVRDVDVVYRRGGEEFTVVLPGADPGEAFGVATRIRDAFLAAAIPHPKQGVVTVSMGVTSYDQLAHRGAGDVMAAADEALRRAKHLGRDRIEVNPQGATAAETA